MVVCNSDVYDSGNCDAYVGVDAYGSGNNVVSLSAALCICTRQKFVFTPLVYTPTRRQVWCSLE